MNILPGGVGIVVEAGYDCVGGVGMVVPEDIKHM